MDFSIGLKCAHETPITFLTESENITSLTKRRVMEMWVSYIFEMDFLQQKNTITKLKPIIEEFEEKGLIKNFNYNHYWSTPPTRADGLAVRLNVLDEKAKKEIDEKLRLTDLRWKEQNYRETEEVKKAYELGSRCAFVFLNLVKREKINEDLLKNPEFCLLMIHGFCNSLGIPTTPDEKNIHYELYHRIAKDHFLKNVELDLKTYIEELNKGIPQSVYQKLVDLSQGLCVEKLNKKFPRTDIEGKTLPLPLENLLWASVLIASAWLGWIFRSKAIWHYGRPHPQEA